MASVRRALSFKLNSLTRRAVVFCGIRNPGIDLMYLFIAAPKTGMGYESTLIPLASKPLDIPATNSASCCLSPSTRKGPSCFESASSYK